MYSYHNTTNSYRNTDGNTDGNTNTNYSHSDTNNDNTDTNADISDTNSNGDTDYNAYIVSAGSRRQRGIASRLYIYQCHDVPCR